MWMFLISPLGRKIAGAALIALALILLIRGWLGERDARIRLEEQRRTFEQIEQTNKENWKTVNARLEAQLADSQLLLADVQRQLAAFQNRKAVVIEKAETHEKEFEDAHKENAPAVADALPDTPEPVKRELDIYARETVELRADVKALASLLGDLERVVAAKDAAHAAEVTALEAKVEQVTTERDFYETAFKGSSPKKRCGLLKKIVLPWACLR
jgi:hypothetical protein